MAVSGSCDDRFSGVRKVFEENLIGEDVGASVAVTVDGEFVVDLWGGHRDAAATVPWERDTIVNVWSSTKTQTALCALFLADRGELDVGAPVARYWPEFAAAGKEAVQVRHLLSHAAGLPGLDDAVAPEALYDWEGMATRLAAQAPWWEPGTQSGYHALTQGYLVGEVVRRISGQSLGTFFHKELAEPLGADFHIGLEPAQFSRVAELIPPQVDAGAMQAPEPGSIAARTFASPVVNARQALEDDWRRAEIPAANGHGNAHSLARVQTLLACGGSAFGKKLMSPAGCERALEEQTNGIDAVLGQRVRYGLGYGLPGGELTHGRGTRSCFWGGYGGSLIVVDMDASLCFAYVMNRMRIEATVGDQRGASLLDATYEALAG
jgi:CubicO group peptidase (beta-lactamase class C family)